MRIVNIRGGLGNQMFQYAFALSLKHRCPEDDVRVDISHYHRIFLNHFKGVNLHYGYEIDALFPNASLTEAKPSQIASVSYYMPNYYLSRIVRHCFPIRKGEYIEAKGNSHTYSEEVYERDYSYYEGYWQSPRYLYAIKDKLYHEFAHPEPDDYNRDLIESINLNNSVGIHVRRGDYLRTPKYYGICGVDYYRKGVELILSDGKPHTFYVFSNDLDWCKTNLLPFLKHSEVFFIMNNTGRKSAWDMFLMTYCKDLIIANSSFSWWGAFLNKNVRKVIAPEPWINGTEQIDIYDQSWIRL